MDITALQSVALEVASARSLEAVLAQVVRGVAADPEVALARIWLIRPGEDCESCALRRECPQNVNCLHLVASEGCSRSDPTLRWNELDGRFRRFPLDRRKVGVVGGSGEALLLDIGGPEEPWVVDPVWVEVEGIRSFAAQPLIFGGEILGVLAVFTRAPVDAEAFAWLRTFADHAAVAIANARAFEEVEALRRQLELERDYLREEVREVQRFAGLVGQSPALRQIEEQIEAVARTGASVLIEGESGTGKELIATAVHEASRRSDEALVRVNCASIPRELFESEFFGHARGSFTGAVGERAGRFEVAHGGTLFLDEVGEIPLELQGKLLRVLQEGQYSRVGEDRIKTVDVRVVSATNRDLKAEVAAGRFREDLYYRLGVFPIRVPPLRERRDDIPLLAAHFVRLLARHCEVEKVKLTRGNLQQLQAYAWPGNVRELRNVIERALILQRGGRLSFNLAGSRKVDPPAETGDEPEVLREDELRAFERENTRRALELCRWRVSGEDGAAAFLGVRPTTLASRMKAMGLSRPPG